MKKKETEEKMKNKLQRIFFFSKSRKKREKTEENKMRKT